VDARADALQDIHLQQTRQLTPTRPDPDEEMAEALRVAMTVPLPPDPNDPNEYEFEEPDLDFGDTE
jgi:hypothetical protein